MGLLLGLIAYPLLEEWLFRGLLLQELERRWPQYSGWYSNLLVSLLFGFIHLIRWSLLHAAAVIVPSLLFGWLWQHYRRLWVCVIAHSVCNAIAYFKPWPGLLW